MIAALTAAGFAAVLARPDVLTQVLVFFGAFVLALLCLSIVASVRFYSDRDQAIAARPAATGSEAHLKISDAERQRILCELARVSRRFVIISFYRSTLLHTLARHWRGSRGRLAMMTLPHLQELAQASGLQIQRVHSLLRFCHAQTFVVLTKDRA